MHSKAIFLSCLHLPFVEIIALHLTDSFICSFLGMLNIKHTSSPNHRRIHSKLHTSVMTFLFMFIFTWFLFPHFLFPDVVRVLLWTLCLPFLQSQKTINDCMLVCLLLPFLNISSVSVGRCKAEKAIYKIIRLHLFASLALKGRRSINSTWEDTVLISCNIAHDLFIAGLVIQ